MLHKTNQIDFIGNNDWPGNSPDLNAYVNLGAIMKRIRDVLEANINNIYSTGVKEENDNCLSFRYINTNQKPLKKYVVDILIKENA